MNYNDEIKSGISVAGFHIGENINSYLPHLYLQEVEVDRVIFSKGKSNEIHCYIIDKNIKINTSEKGEILNISCTNTYYGKYKDILYLSIRIMVFALFYHTLIMILIIYPIYQRI